MRYFLRLAYNGAPFHGWQSQPNAVSVQQTLEEALTMILREETKITGAGRTDTGVNARLMYAHFDVADKIADRDSFINRINSITGRDIVVSELIPVALDAHARFDATQRTYRYFIHTQRSPFLYPFSWYSHRRLDFAAMNEAAATLRNYTDFTSFSKLHTDVKTNNCRIDAAHWVQIDESRHYFEISADRFLRNMVRAVVGTLIDVGIGKLSLNGFHDIIMQQNRCAAGTSMPPHPLFLWDIKYPYL